MNRALTPDQIHGTAMDYLRHAAKSKWALTTYLARRFGPEAAQTDSETRRRVETELETLCANGQARKADSARGATCYLPTASQNTKHTLPQLAPTARDYDDLEEKFRANLRELNITRERLSQARENNERLHALAMRLARRIESKDGPLPTEINNLKLPNEMEHHA